MPTAMINGLNIAYEQAGSGPHLVLIHGLTGDLAIWRALIGPTLSETFTVLTYDLRGHGQSDMPPTGYRTSDMAADLLGLLDHLQIEWPHLVGHSMGGTIALHFAGLYPDRVGTLTVSDARIRVFQPSLKLKDWPHWPLWKDQLEKRGIVLDDDSEMDFLLLNQLAPPPPATPAQGAAAGSQRIERWNRLLDSTTAKEDFKDSAGLDEDLIRRVVAPTHAIYGEYSFCGPSLAGLQRLLSDLQVTIIPKAGHFFPITRPDLFLSRLKSLYDAKNAPP